MIDLIGAAIDQCASMRGAASTPLLVSHALDRKFKDIIYYNETTPDIEKLGVYFNKLGNSVHDTLVNNKFPIIIGGDHSCAIGTWSGVSEALSYQNKELGLIWFDAHMDSHRPDTSESGNIHGMPLAVLLGYGQTEFRHVMNKMPKIKPENLVLVGIRSFESPEKELLDSLGVKVFYNTDIFEHGFKSVFNSAMNYLSSVKVGFSIDVDGFDPSFAPGAGTLVPDGINFNEFLAEYKTVDFANIVAIEITEANLKLDKENKTLYCIRDIVNATNNSNKLPF